MKKILEQINANEFIAEILYGSEQYEQEVALRYEVLRKPLGLEFTPEQLKAESELIHLGYFQDEELEACLILAPEGAGRMKMKQVTVATSRQGRGIGRKLVEASEQLAQSLGYHIMYCHARDTAVAFYEKMGYKKVGDMFTEVTIPHFEMEKKL